MSLDDDVAAQIEQLRARGGRTFKQLVNEALRLGLEQLDRAPDLPGGPFTRVVSLGRPRLPDLDDVSAAIALAEGDAHR